MALPSSGEISILDIYRNQQNSTTATPGANSNQDITSFSGQFASGSTVGDVDGNGTPNLTGRFVLGTGTVDATKENNSPYHTNNYREKKPYNQNLEFTMGKTGGQDMQKINTNQLPCLLYTYPRPRDS